ncbi:MAG: phenylacetate--CoA ligase [Clostridiaceae bacterium]|nr:phenylacetate--CoA ligase [Clostridiaceae bacterium]
MIYNREMECIDRKKLQELQLRKLQETVKRVYDKVPFYRKKLDEANIKPDDIKKLEDIRKIPFTTKEDLRQNYPYGLFAVPLKDVVRIHGSSGTTGKPTIVGYTKNDIEMWSECVARIVTAAGATREDVAQIAFGFGLFTGAFGLQQGLEKIGATIIPMSSGNTEKQIMMMQDLGTTVLVSTPSYALYMSEVAEQMGIKNGDLKLRLGLFGAEGHTEEMRKELEKRWGIQVTENYGLSEIVGPGVAGECLEHKGQHINEDHFLFEIIDPESGEVLPWGEKGEIVITPLSKEALPLLRYRTKDISYIMDDPCPCGRTTARMAKIQGRSDDMLIIKGVNVFPSQVESVLLNIEGVGPHYQLVVRKNGFVDDLEVLVEVVDSSLLEKFSELEALEQRVKSKIHTVLGIDTKVRLVEPRSIERSMGKAKRVIDLRNQK